MYPEAHGIIASSFYDPEFNATFTPGSAESFLGRWWGGEPIWNTLNKQVGSIAVKWWGDMSLGRGMFYIPLVLRH